MKTTITKTTIWFSMLSLTLLFSELSAQSKNTVNVDTGTPVIICQEQSNFSELPFGVSLNRAIENITLFANTYSTPVNNYTLASAFTIHKSDLFNALGISPDAQANIQTSYNHVRAYLGLDTTDHLLHLYLIPTMYANLSDTPQAFGRDVVFNFSSTGPNEYFVLDLNAPCPKLCSEGAMPNSIAQHGYKPYCSYLLQKDYVKSKKDNSEISNDKNKKAKESSKTKNH